MIHSFIFFGYVLVGVISSFVYPHFSGKTHIKLKIILIKIFYIYLHPSVQKEHLLDFPFHRVWSSTRCALSSNQQWFFFAKKDFVKRKNPSS